MSNKKPALTDKKYALPFVLITVLFFLIGFSRAILDVLNKHFQNTLCISITRSSLIQVMTFLGYFLLAIPAGKFITKYGYRRGVIFGLILFAVGAFLFIPSALNGSFYAFLFCLFIIGCGLVFLETASNPYATELGPKETSASRLVLSQSFNGLGSMMATLCVGQFLFSGYEEGHHIWIPYAILGAVVLVIAIIFSHVSLPEIKYDTTDEEKGHPYRSLLKEHRIFVFGLLALLAYEFAEISINSYFINFTTGMDWMTDRTASLVLTGALALFMVGRFFGSWIMRMMSAEKWLLVCATVTVLDMILIMTLCKIGKLSLFFLILNYFFEAIMFPTIFSIALRGLGGLTKTASSLLMMTPIGGCGFLLIGLLADRTHVVLPFIVPLIGFIIVWLYALTVLSRSKREGARRRE
ncbi:MAG: MFS transporter [Prevotella sp.]|jgi:FHS family L-fucose permease-like MFS transporter|nr:MFS transporter [Prevotella sp.]MCH3985014.1 MFS transporter [Prevotella sp.]MCH3992708.1 MFS transporter [Prevotella sp.]MCH4019119.1 MFS transporter [Prevotella sp.]MCH4099285.1 MFS transporter [Prevotella sp.]